MKRSKKMSKVAASSSSSLEDDLTNALHMQMHDALLSLRLEVLDKDLFRSVRLFAPPGARGVYGGQLVANAVEAACQSVDLKRLSPHSIHSMFLRPGLTTSPIYFRVRRIRDGASFATRTVTAQQFGEPVFFAIVSFHKDEASGQKLPSGIRHGQDFPAVPGPELGISEREFIDEILKSNPSERFWQNLKFILSRPKLPLRIRYVPSKRVAESLCNGVPGQGSTPTESNLRREPLDIKRMARYSWMKVNVDIEALFQKQTESEQNGGGVPLTKLSHERAHMLTACWCSDFFLAIAGVVPHGFPNPNVQMLVSLDHTIYFHNSHRRLINTTSGDFDGEDGATPKRKKASPRSVMGFPVDEWFLYEVFSPCANNSRALNMGRIFSQVTGQLEMTIVQETLVRTKEGFTSHL